MYFADHDDDDNAFDEVSNACPTCGATLDEVNANPDCPDQDGCAAYFVEDEDSDDEDDEEDYGVEELDFDCD